MWALVYAELGSAFPYAGGDYVGVGRVLGAWAGVVTLAVWAVTAGPSVAFAAQTMTTYVRQLAPHSSANTVTFGGVAAALGVALMSVRRGAWVTGVFLALELIAVVVLIIVGLHPPARGLDAIPFTRSRGRRRRPCPVPLGVVALAAVSAVYATVGGNAGAVLRRGTEGSA